MIQILSVVKYVNKAVSTLVMVMYEQDYRGTALSMEAEGLILFMLNTGIFNLCGLFQICLVAGCDISI